MSKIIIPPVECAEEGCTAQDKNPFYCSGCEYEHLPWFEMEAGVDTSSQPDQTSYPEQTQEEELADKLENIAQAIKELAAALHPKWLHYYMHSKKKRVRKKYYNFIKREFWRLLNAKGAI